MDDRVRQQGRARDQAVGQSALVHRKPIRRRTGNPGQGNKSGIEFLVVSRSGALCGVYAVLVKAFFHKKERVSKPRATSPQLKELGNNIRRERSIRGMTQERLAELADLNVRNVQRIEAGEVDVLLATATRIRRSLACSWERLIPKDWR